MASDVSTKTLFLVTDVTQMRGDKVCILGVNDKFETIRPELPPPGIFQHRLVLPTGVIRPRSVLEIYFKPPHKINPPHIEDKDWDINHDTRFLRTTDNDKWRNALEQTLFLTVQDIFETKITNKAIEPYKGVRSVGTIRVKTIEFFKYGTVERREGIKHDYRLSFRDESNKYYYDLSITDLTFRYYFHHLLTKMTPEKASWRIREQLQETDCYLRIGLTREYNGNLWLQVNGIYTFPDYAKGMCFMDYKQAGVTLPD
jgi:hypothetical protein